MGLLLIADDSSTAKSIEMIVKSDGYICDTMDLGEDGLEIGKIYDHDLIVLDLIGCVPVGCYLPDPKIAFRLCR